MALLSRSSSALCINDYNNCFHTLIIIPSTTKYRTRAEDVSMIFGLFFSSNDTSDSRGFRQSVIHEFIDWFSVFFSFTRGIFILRSVYIIHLLIDVYYYSRNLIITNVFRRYSVSKKFNAWSILLSQYTSVSELTNKCSFVPRK